MKTNTSIKTMDKKEIQEFSDRSYLIEQQFKKKNLIILNTESVKNKVKW